MNTHSDPFEQEMYADLHREIVGELEMETEAWVGERLRRSSMRAPSAASKRRILRVS